MFGMIGGFLSRWLGGGVGMVLIAAVVVIGGWLWHSATVARLEAKLAEQENITATTEANRDLWMAAAEARQQALDNIHQDMAAARAANAKLKARLAQKDDAYQELRRRIALAPAADDGPVAPVLRQVLEGLP